MSILLKNYPQFLTKILVEKVCNAVFFSERVNFNISCDSQIELHITPVKFNIPAKYGFQRNETWKNMIIVYPVYGQLCRKVVLVQITKGLPGGPW